MPRDLRHVDACGGATIVQDLSSCVAPDMPQAALHTVSPDRVVPLESIAAAIVCALTDHSRSSQYGRTRADCAGSEKLH
ncbi:chemotaxis protein CheB [Paraburkholderia strydomiana]|uniref:chemotaxis protein CheB n=1 Tax=Paraburkholderia strydomiana TaxID=1245417 RepID=UPI0038BBAE6A